MRRVAFFSRRRCWPNCLAGSRAAHGRNMLPDSSNLGWLTTLKEVVLEPMFLLLSGSMCRVFRLGPG